MKHETTQTRERIYANVIILSCAFVFLFAWFSVHEAIAATLFMQPASGDLVVGDTFALEVRLDTEGEEINAVEAHVAIPRDAFEVIDVDNGGSVFTLWPRPPQFSLEEGTADFAGGTPEGFIGKDGLLGRIFLRAKSAGDTATLSFKDTRAFLNDGNATPARVSLLESFFAIEEGPRIQIAGFSSPSHLDQLLWSKNSTLVIHWDAKSGVRYSYLLSRDVFAEPDDIPDTPVGDIKYENLEDGIYYFHLCELHETDLCQSVSKWGAMIDATSPEAFDVRLVDDAELGIGTFLSFSTRDILSGLDRYELCYGENVPGQEGSVRACRVVSPPVLLTPQDKKQEILVVRAHDRAGNLTDAAIELPPRAGNIAKYIIIIVGGLLGVGILLLVARMSRLRASARTLFKGT